MNREEIKYIAIIAMTFNHAAHALMTPGTLLFETMENIGYITAMVMAFFLVEGFHYTRSVRKYAVRLLIFAALSQLPYMKSQGYEQLNMLFTVLIGLGILCAMQAEAGGNIERSGSNTAGAVSPAGSIRWKIVCAGLILMSFVCDWGVLFPVTVMYLEKSRGDRQRQLRVYLIIAAVFVLLNTSTFYQEEGALFAASLLRGAFSSIGILAAAVLVLFVYNGQTEQKYRRFHKWFFYIYYPLHLAILWGIKVLLA